MLFGMMAACSSTEQPTASPSPVESPTPATNSEDIDGDEIPALYPICEPGSVTLSYWMPRDSMVLTAIKDFTENPTMQYAEEKLGVKIDWIHVTNSNAAELFNLMIASNDLTDIITTGTRYINGPDAAIEDGYYLKLNGLIDEFCPNYSATLNSYEVWRRDSATDMGNLWAFFAIYSREKLVNGGPMFRQDILGNYGYSYQNNNIPKTIGEWDSLFADLKAQGYTESLALMDAGYDTYNQYTWTSAFGTHTGFINKNGVATFGPLEPGFKNYVQLMRDWYEKGYIVEDFALYSWAQVFRDLLNDRIAVFSGADGFAGDALYASGQSTNSDMYCIGAVYPTVNAGDTLHLRNTFSYLSTPTVITGSCSNPEIAAKWCDFWYSEEGILAANYGSEGETYNMVDGKPVFTELITHNTQGLPLLNALQAYTFMGGCSIELPGPQYDYAPAKVESCEIWNPTPNDWVMPSTLTLTPAEGSENSSIMTDIQTYLQESLGGFISGMVSMDKYDDFIAQIKSMRIDRAIAIQQAALDRYYAR